MKRTERTPAQTFLGAFAPMPSPVATAPPGMIERKVLVCGGRTAGTLGGRKKRGVNTKTRDGRRGIHASLIQHGPGTPDSKRTPSPSPHGRPLPAPGLFTLPARFPLFFFFCPDFPMFPDTAFRLPHLRSLRPHPTDASRAGCSIGWPLLVLQNHVAPQTTGDASVKHVQKLSSRSSFSRAFRGGREGACGKSGCMKPENARSILPKWMYSVHFPTSPNNPVGTLPLDDHVRPTPIRGIRGLSFVPHPVANHHTRPWPA